MPARVPEPLRVAVCVSGRRCVSYLMASVRPSVQQGEGRSHRHLDRGGRPCRRGGRGVPQMRVPGLPAVCAVCACAGAGPTCVLCAVVGAAVRSAQASYLVESVRPSVPAGFAGSRMLLVLSHGFSSSRESQAFSSSYTIIDCALLRKNNSLITSARLLARELF